MEAAGIRIDNARRVPIELEPSAACVKPEHVDYFWPKVNHWIRAAVAEAVHHELSAQELYRRCKSGEYLMVLLAIGESLQGVAVLEKSVNAKGDTYICITACGGERMPEWIGTLVNTCQALGREAGAVELMLIGRPGWKPYLQALGARVKCICMSMEVTS